MIAKKTKYYLIAGATVGFFLLIFLIWFFSTPTTPTTTLPAPIPETTPAADSKLITIIVVLVIGLLVIASILAYFLFINKEQLLTLDVIKQVPTDKAVNLFLQNFTAKYDVPVHYEQTKEFGQKVVFPNHSDYTELTRINHWEKDDRFCILEFEINTGTMKGIHTVDIPLTKGEEAILYGDYELHTKKSLNNYQRKPRTWVRGNYRDKELRQSINLAEARADLYDPDEIDKIVNKTAPPVLVSAQQGGSKGFSRNDFDELKEFVLSNPNAEKEDFFKQKNE